MSAHDPPPEFKFKANVLSMKTILHRIIERASNLGYTQIKPMLVDVGAGYIDKSFSDKELIENFILISHPLLEDGSFDHTLWDKVLARDEDFFSQNALNIFKGLPDPIIIAFNKLWNQGSKEDPSSLGILQEEKDKMIHLFHTFVRFSIRYLIRQRDPYCKIEEDGTRRYISRKKFFPGINALRHAKKWGIELDIPVC